MKYEAELYIITRGDQMNKNGNPVVVERIDIPVHSFEVEGGANRKINLASTDEVSISSEFEQARAHTNFIFYVPPTKDFLALKLMNLSVAGNWQVFHFTFAVHVYSRGKKIQTLRIMSEMASLREPPTPIGKTPPLLMTKVRLVRPEMLHGQYDPKLKKIIHKKI
jgi:hypothetical protein